MKSECYEENEWIAWGHVEIWRLSGCENSVNEREELVYSVRSFILSQWRERKMSDMTGFRSFNSVTCNRENIIARRHTRSVWNSTVYVVQIKKHGRCNAIPTSSLKCLPRPQSSSQFSTFVCLKDVGLTNFYFSLKLPCFTNSCLCYFDYVVSRLYDVASYMLPQLAYWKLQWHSTLTTESLLGIFHRIALVECVKSLFLYFNAILFWSSYFIAFCLNATYSCQNLKMINSIFQCYYGRPM